MSHIFSVPCAIAYCMTRIVLWPHNCVQGSENAYFFWLCNPLICQLKATNHGCDQLSADPYSVCAVVQVSKQTRRRWAL